MQSRHLAECDLAQINILVPVPNYTELAHLFHPPNGELAPHNEAEIEKNALSASEVASVPAPKVPNRYSTKRKLRLPQAMPTEAQVSAGGELSAPTTGTISIIIESSKGESSAPGTGSAFTNTDDDLLS